MITTSTPRMVGIQIKAGARKRSGAETQKIIASNMNDLIDSIKNTYWHRIVHCIKCLRFNDPSIDPSISFCRQSCWLAHFYILNLSHDDVERCIMCLLTRVNDIKFIWFFFHWWNNKYGLSSLHSQFAMCVQIVISLQSKFDDIVEKLTCTHHIHNLSSKKAFDIFI